MFLYSHAILVHLTNEPSLSGGQRDSRAVWIHQQFQIISVLHTFGAETNVKSWSKSGFISLLRHLKAVIEAYVSFFLSSSLLIATRGIQRNHMGLYCCQSTWFACRAHMMLRNWHTDTNCTFGTADCKQNTGAFISREKGKTVALYSSSWSARRKHQLVCQAEAWPLT
jgi:hypothetical protein